MAELIDMLFGVSTLRSPESIPTKKALLGIILITGASPDLRATIFSTSLL